MILVTDSHVSVANGNSEAFFDMLALLETSREKIVFLGDIFDLWISLPRYEEDIQRRFLQWCARNSTNREIGFVEGNHEFYVAGEKAAHFTWCVREKRHVQESRLLFVHGDCINHQDKKYLFFRLITKNLFCKTLFRLLPYGPALAQKLKKRLKITNMDYKIGLPRQIVDDFAKKRFAEGVRQIFVGHFHEPYRFSNDEGRLDILPDWFSTGKISIYRESDGVLVSIPWQQLEGSPVGP